MKIPKLMTMLAPVILAAGCETTNRQPTYSSQTTHGAEVISSPGYPTTYYTNSSYYPSTYPPVYTDKSVTQGAAAANQTMNETDRALAYSIQQEFSRHTDLAGVAPNVYVTVRNGAVVLNGTVPSERERQAIDNVVRNVNGVTSVNDQMRVSAVPTGRADENTRIYSSESQTAPPPTGVAETTGEMFSLHVQSLAPNDRNLGQRILEGLRTDNVLASALPKVNIDVQNGRIVLRGNVQSDYQRQTILQAVKRAAGTEDVQDELRLSR